MKYILIYSDFNGVMCQSEDESYINASVDELVNLGFEFLEKPVFSLSHMRKKTAFLMKGEVVIPKPIESVNQFEI